MLVPKLQERCWFVTLSAPALLEVCLRLLQLRRPIRRALPISRREAEGRNPLSLRLIYRSSGAFDIFAATTELHKEGL